MSSNARSSARHHIGIVCTQAETIFPWNRMFLHLVNHQLIDGLPRWTVTLQQTQQQAFYGTTWFIVVTYYQGIQLHIFLVITSISGDGEGPFLDKRHLILMCKDFNYVAGLGPSTPVVFGVFAVRQLDTEEWSSMIGGTQGNVMLQQEVGECHLGTDGLQVPVHEELLTDWLGTWSSRHSTLASGGWLIFPHAAYNLK